MGWEDPDSNPIQDFQNAAQKYFDNYRKVEQVEIKIERPTQIWKETEMETIDLVCQTCGNTYGLDEIEDHIKDHASKNELRIVLVVITKPSSAS